MRTRASRCWRRSRCPSSSTRNARRRRKRRTSSPPPSPPRRLSSLGPLLVTTAHSQLATGYLALAQRWPQLGRKDEQCTKRVRQRTQIQTAPVLFGCICLASHKPRHSFFFLLKRNRSLPAIHLFTNRFRVSLHHRYPFMACRMHLEAADPCRIFARAPPPLKIVVPQVIVTKNFVLF